MRVSVLLVLLAVSTAHADPRVDVPLPHHFVEYGGEVQVLDFRGGSAAGAGFSGGLSMGRGRWHALGEVALGGLVGDRDIGWLGYYGQTTLGVRYLAITVSPEGHGRERLDLVLEGGVGAVHAWVDRAGGVERPYAFLGWGSLLRFWQHRGASLHLRAMISPKLDDARVLRVICRGTCPGPDDAPADLTIALTFGVVRW